MQGPEMVVIKTVKADKTVQYECTVRTRMRLSGFADVPDEYIAAYIANELREYVNKSILSEHVHERIEQARGKMFCPLCGKEISENEQS